MLTLKALWFALVTFAACGINEQSLAIALMKHGWVGQTGTLLDGTTYVELTKMENPKEGARCGR